MVHHGVLRRVELNGLRRASALDAGAEGVFRQLVAVVRGVDAVTKFGLSTTLASAAAGLRSRSASLSALLSLLNVHGRRCNPRQEPRWRSRVELRVRRPCSRERSRRGCRQASGQVVACVADPDEVVLVVLPDTGAAAAVRRECRESARTRSARTPAWRRRVGRQAPPTRRPWRWCGAKRASIGPARSWLLPVSADENALTLAPASAGGRGFPAFIQTGVSGPPEASVVVVSTTSRSPRSTRSRR